MTTIAINDEELELDDSDFLCPQCNGSGEGMYDGSICHACHGSGVERDDSGREDYEADGDDPINEDRKPAGARE